MNLPAAAYDICCFFFREYLCRKQTGIFREANKHFATAQIRALVIEELQPVVLHFGCIYQCVVGFVVASGLKGVPEP